MITDQTFESMGLQPETLQAVAKMGFTCPDLRPGTDHPGYAGLA